MGKKCDHDKRLKVDCGEESIQYQYGNYLNAIEQVTSYFLIKLNCSEGRLAESLTLYAKHLREDY